jgi:hypothetical protein
VQRSQTQPSALDVLHPGRVAVLFEGRERAVAAQLDTARALVGGGEADPGVWAESRARQGESRGALRFDPGALADTLAGLSEAVVRPSAGLAYVTEPVESDLAAGVRRLNRALKAQLDPAGVLT